MGLFGDLVGGFFGGGIEEPYIDPEETLEEVRPYWQQYRQLQSDVTSSYEGQYETLETQLAFGRIPQEAYEARKREVDLDKAAELRTLSTGATANILRDEFDFQQQFLRSQYEGQLRDYENQRYVQRGGTPERGGEDTQLGEPAGWYRTVETGGRDTTDVYQFVGEEKPEPPPMPADLEIDDFESFFVGRFGEPDIEQFDRGQTSAPRARAGTRTTSGGGGGAGQAVGVGRIYSIY